MLVRVRGVVAFDLRQRERAGDGVAVEEHFAERRRKRAGRRQREAPHRRAVRGTEQHDAADDLAHRGEPSIAVARDRPRIDVPGVRNDDRLRRRSRDLPRRLGGGEVGAHVRRERGGRSGVEKAGDGRGDGQWTSGVGSPSNADGGSAILRQDTTLRAAEFQYGTDERADSREDARLVAPMSGRIRGGRTRGARNERAVPGERVKPRRTHASP